MSTCLIISQGEKMYIGADTACSVKTENGYQRFSNNMQKLFTIGNNVFFCSGKKQDVEKCINWIYDSFSHSINVMELEQYLRNNFSTTNQDNIFNIEFLLCDYNAYCITQLSQYNNFKPVKYEKSNQLRIICGGYKTKDSFFIAKNNILSQIPIKDVYNNVFDDIADECVGGNVILFDSPIHFEKMLVNEKDIKYTHSDNLFLLTSDFVTAGYIYGSQIISGDIYSENYKVDANGNVIDGSHLALKTGGFSLGAGKLEYDPITNKMICKGLTIQWDTSTPPEISDINGLENSLATTLEKAEEGIQKGLEGITLANSAKTYAEGVNNSLSNEITNRINADNKLSTDITSAYTTYTNSAVSNLDKSVASYLGVNGGTLITEKGVISPYIAGGYLNITNTSNNSCVIIDPNNLTQNDYIFQVHNGSEISVGIKTNGDAIFSGTVYATNGSFTGTVTSSQGIIGGWNISDNVLYDYNGTISTVGAGMQSWFYNDETESPLANIVSFWAGAPFKNRDNAPFIVTRDGDVISNSLKTSNITITGGSININNKFIVDKDGNVTLPSNASISWSQVTGTEGVATQGYVTSQGYQTASQVTQITNDTIKTTNVTATNLKVKAANIDGTLTASQINTTGLIAENISGTTITGKTISGGSISIGSNFSVSNSGVLSCSGAIISGKVTTTSGSIANWNIYSAGFLGSAYRRSSDNYYYGIAFDTTQNSFNNNYRVMAIGRLGTTSSTSAESAITTDTWGNAAFTVKADGSVTTTNITATGGTVGGWTINGSSLSGTQGSVTVELTGGGIYRHLGGSSGITQFLSWAELFSAVGYETM